MDARRWRWAPLIAGLALALADVPAARGGEPSEEYKAGLRRTLELKRQRRGVSRAPAGVIVPYPMPPTLIIRQTRENHEEIGVLLDLLRYGGR
ncbi:MAG TPA: hypothetical protein VGH33_01225 [Isosphaeraceae bacterium]